MMILVGDRTNRSCVATVLFLVLCRLFREQSSGRSFLLFGLLMVFLSVVRLVGRLLDGNVGSRPAELVKDGDLVLLIGRIFGDVRS